MLFASLLTLNTVIGFVAGSVVTVFVPAVFAWVKKQGTSVATDVAPTVAKVEGQVSAAVNSAANTVSKAL